MDSKAIVSQMTLEEKAALCSGKDFWHMKGLERLGLPSIMVTDGPHGLRKQAGDTDHLGINKSIPATCFPAACATSCSFDRNLMQQIGKALGEECLQEDVGVLLGPGANIKRSPLCGRNFEYISEDPYVTGEMATAIIQGIQSQGVGTSFKHYAANNQESCRMTGSSVVDERALREIYLSGFEKAVKEAQPQTIMCAYNQVNGTFASEDAWLLTDVLRDEWGFEGIVMTDWGATNDRVRGLRAGLDLEMPASGGLNDAKIVAAVQDGTLAETTLDTVVVRLVDLILSAQRARQPGYTYDAEAHHALARKAAAESAVLLKNDEAILPVQAKSNIAIIGAFAKKPRYQGAGSSKIQPSRMDNAFDSLVQQGVAAEYAEGYSLASGVKADEALMQDACRIAQGKDVVLLFAGLPDEYESEGFDRKDLALPDAHSKLIDAVSKVNNNVVVVLLCGAPIVMPWAHQVKGILLMYLGGQAGGGGCADILLGRVNPSGKLAESFPLALEDNPSFAYFPGTRKSVEYRESIFVGYRYYDAAEKEVAFPFGYGLSYTTFQYSDLSITSTDFSPGQRLSVSFTVTNTGAVAGAEIAQLYIGMAGSSIYRPVKEIKGFEKVFLQPGENTTVTLLLEDRSFAYYNVPAHCWAIEGGTYTIYVGSSSRQVHLQGAVQVAGDGKETLLVGLAQKAPTYFALPKDSLRVPDVEFEAVYGRPIPPSQRLPGEPFTINSTLYDIKDTFIGKQVLKRVQKEAAKMLGENMSPDFQNMANAMLMDLPLRALGMMSGGSMPPSQIEGIVEMANGHLFKGFGFLNSKDKK